MRDGCASVGDGIIRVLFFGRIYRYKGLDVLIRSMPLVAEELPTVRAVIAGVGEDLTPYKRTMTHPNLFEIRNRFIADEETARLFTEADVVVFPYLEASQSGVLAIANAFAKPVIVTDVGELSHSVTDGETGLVIPPGDERALAEAILRLASDEGLRARLGDAGRTVALETASPKAVADKAMNIYREVSACTRLRRAWPGAKYRQSERFRP
jgi:glycosyltransferase involved in cell wall biosynthesis